MLNAALKEPIPDEITVLGTRVRLRQIPHGFKTSMDSVLLAAACPAKPGEHILDLGCGVGSAGLCAIYRVPDSKLTGIDILPDHIALAKDNAALNHKNTRSTFIAEDIRDFEPITNGQQLRFDHVICNPPYLESGAHIESPKAYKQLAIGEGEDGIDLKDWLDAAHRNLRSGGALTIVNRADAVDKIIRKMGKRFGAIEIIPIWPKLSIDAKRVIIRGIKDRQSPATLHPGIVMHDDGGEYTSEAHRILREGQRLF